MLISTGNLQKGLLSGQVALISGAGGGIGFEAARALIWLGAKVVIAEVRKERGAPAAAALNEEFGAGSAVFIKTDVGHEVSVRTLKKRVFDQLGRVDIVINNATVAPLGAVVDVPIQLWDTSYQVNLRAPVLLAQAFLAHMVKRGSGSFLCVSSEGLEYMSAYESIKAAQVHLANTLDAEVEGSGVAVFSIGPGFVPTETALTAIPKLAKWMGKTEAEMQALLAQYTISVEAAGAGFAAAAVLAENYRGLEISSLQALTDAGINPYGDALPEENRHPDSVLETRQTVKPAQAGGADLLTQCQTVRKTLAEQAAGWLERPVFERQWMLRNFKKKSGYPVETWSDHLAQLELALVREDLSAVTALNLPLHKLADFYGNLADMAKSYGKTPQQRQEQTQIVLSWKAEVDLLIELLGK